MSVFYDAGLVFESNTASGTAYRQGLQFNFSVENPNFDSKVDKVTVTVRDKCFDFYTLKVERGLT